MADRWYKIPKIKKGSTQTDVPLFEAPGDAVSITKEGVNYYLVRVSAKDVLTLEAWEAENIPKGLGKVLGLSDVEIESEFQMFTGKSKAKAEIDAEFKVS